MRNKYIISFLLAGIIFLCTFHFTQAYSISPHTLDIELDPGQTYEGKITLYDENFQKTKVSIEAKSFSVDYKTSKFKELIDPPAGEDTWVEFSQNEVELPDNGQSVEVDYKITAPEDAEVGTHQIAFSYLSAPASEDENEESQAKVYINSNIVTNIFLRIKGLVIEKADVEVLAVTKDPKYFKTDEDRNNEYRQLSLFEKTPIYFVIRFKNDSNVHLRPDGNIEVTNRKGDIKFKEKASEEVRIVPSKSNKEYIVGPFEDKLAFGQYFAEATMLYGNDTKEASQKIEFFIFPWKIILLIIIIIIIIITLIILWRRHRRKKKIEEEKKYRENYKKDVSEEVSKILKEKLPEVKNKENTGDKIKKDK